MAAHEQEELVGLKEKAIEEEGWEGCRCMWVPAMEIDVEGLAVPAYAEWEDDCFIRYILEKTSNYKSTLAYMVSG